MATQIPLSLKTHTGGDDSLKAVPLYPNAIVRATHPEDAPLLKSMLHACISNLVERYYSPNPGKLREWLSLITEEGLIRGATDPNFCSFVICEPKLDIPIGLGSFDLARGRGLQNYVSPGHQGRGIGKIIATKLDKIATAAGYRSYPGLATRAGLRFWESQGHVRTGPPQLFLDFYEMFPVLRTLPFEGGRADEACNLHRG
jgi:GNAT superfamily N-acetyltransferase